MKIESKKRALDKIYKRRDRYEIPDWQREEVGYADYQNLITDLYFVFWEGVGDRLKGKMSTSFVDINSLRTDLQHDLDHGKAKKSASKRRKVSAAFSKYASAPTPTTTSPEHFPVFQVGLLTQIEKDLRTILASI